MASLKSIEKDHRRRAATKATSPATSLEINRLHLIAIGVLALVVRVLYLFELRHVPLLSLLMGDAQSYDSWAREIAAGDWLGHQVFYQAPLYPYFLGLIYSLFGHDLWIVRIAQILLGSCACVLLAQAGRHFFSVRTGIVAGALLAIYPLAFYYDGLIQKSVLDTFFICLLLYAMARALDEPKWSRWIGVGAALGTLALARENALVFAVVILAWILIGLRQLSWINRAACLGYFVLGLAVVLFPVALRNEVVGGEFHLTTSQFGPNLYIGNNENANGSYRPLREGRGTAQFERQDAVELAEAEAGHTLGPAEVSRYWSEKAFSFMQANPHRWFRLMAKKWLLVWNRLELADMEDPYTYGDSSVLLGGLLHIFHFGILCPLAVFGITLSWRRYSQSRWLVVMLLCYAASVALFYVFGRYRFPLTPFLILFAAIGIVDGMTRLKEGSYATLLACGTLAIGAGVVSNLEIIPRSEMQAVTQYNMGVYLAEQLGDQKGAIESYTAALRLDPNQADVHNNLGLALAQEGQVEEAIGHFEQALRIKPRFDEAHNNLGIALAHAGRTHDAILHFEQALEIRPDYAIAHDNLANVLLMMGRSQDAILHYEEALRIRPDYAEAHNNLGAALQQVGQTKDAVRHFEEALRIKPDYTDAQNNLARARTSP